MDVTLENSKMTHLAPVVLFTYNRLWHTRQTVEALQRNELATRSDLIIYSDAPKKEQAWSQVQDVRNYLKTITGFKSLKIIEREENWGLAKSIISGVTEVVNEYGKVIVLEDDIVTSPVFLRFMNDALIYYENKNKVWHISGWNYPINSTGLDDVFFWRVMNCWGWATWADRWAKFEKNPERLIAEWTEVQKHHFDLDGSGVFWSQIEANKKGVLNTWAIFWYATIYQNKGLCLNPTLSYVENIGHDGSGEHCGDVGQTKFVVVNQNQKTVFTDQLEESQIAIERIKNYYRSLKKTFLVRAINKLSRIVIRKNLIT